MWFLVIVVRKYRKNIYNVRAAFFNKGSFLLSKENFNNLMMRKLSSSLKKRIIEKSTFLF